MNSRKKDCYQKVERQHALVGWGGEETECVWLGVYVGVVVKEDSEGASPKLKEQLVYGPAAPSLRISPKQVKSILVFSVGSLAIPKTWKQTESANLRMDRENGAQTDSGLLFSHEKE